MAPASDHVLTRAGNADEQLCRQRWPGRGTSTSCGRGQPGTSTAQPGFIYAPPYQSLRLAAIGRPGFLAGAATSCSASAAASWPAEALSDLFSGGGLFGGDRDYGEREYDQGYYDGRQDEERYDDDRQDDGGSQYDGDGGYDALAGGFDDGGGFEPGARLVTPGPFGPSMCARLSRRGDPRVGWMACLACSSLAASVRRTTSTRCPSGASNHGLE